MTDYDHKLALINLAFSSYLRRRIMELNNGDWPPISEMYSTLSRIFTEQFPQITLRTEAALNLFAERIDDNLEKYIEMNPEYDIITFIDYAEKYVKGELRQARHWASLHYTTSD